MDDLKFGTRNKRGDWAPNAPLQIASSWASPPNLMKFLKFLPGYIWPWNAFHMATTLLYWYFIVPDIETMKTISLGWALWLYAVNAAAIFAMYGSVELFWYVKRKQGTRFKYNGKFPSENPSDVFWFKSQNIDNFLRSFFISIPLWTLVERAVSARLCNGLCAVAGLGRSPDLFRAADTFGARDPRGAFLLHPPSDPCADPL